MKFLQVIHRYPMRYNAGLEVYTQVLVQERAERHDIHVSARQENAIQQESDPSDFRIALYLINMVRARDGYHLPTVETAFAELLDLIQPEVVHIGQLNHLSTSLVFAARNRGIPVVFTLHDYWLMCLRGQFIQMYPHVPSDAWAVCDGQDDRKCAERCYSRYFGGVTEQYETDAAYWNG